jgi:hypothetical protein
VYRSTIASSAFLPSHGSALACARVPVKGDRHLDDGEAVDLGAVRVRRVDLEARVDIGEGAGVDEVHLPAAGLLGGGADEADLAAEVAAQRPSRRHRRPGARRAHEVVPAAVADLGKGVVLAGESHDRPRAAPRPARHERRVEAADRRGHLKAVALEQLGRPARRLVLLECQLGSRVHPMRQLERAGQDGGDRILEGGGGIGHGCLHYESLRTKNHSRAPATRRTKSATGTLSAPARRSPPNAATISPARTPRRAALLHAPR